MPSVADRVKETTTTAGSGTITLAGAATGYRTFATAFSDGTVVYYCIVSGNMWEVGSGTYNSSTLTRSTILSSSSGGSAISLSGTSDVFCTLPAQIPKLSDVSSATTYYLGMTTSTSGTFDDIRVDASDMYYTSGDNTLYATNMNTASDERLKENISPISNALDVIKQIEGVSFNWKTTGRKSYGVIAQQIEQFLPELVNDVDDKKSVNYNAIIGFLIEAIKELELRIEK